MTTADYDTLSSVTGTYTATEDGADTYIKWTASPATMVTS